MSLAWSVMTSGVPAPTVTLLFWETGASLTGVTVIATIAVAVPPAPSEIVYAKESEPL